MSFDYYVAIRKADWPTAAVVQASLEALGVPLELQQADDQLFSVVAGTLGLPVLLDGRPVVIEADIEQATDVDDDRSLFGYISQCAAPNFRITNGDYFLTLTFRSDADEIRAGLYLAATMILRFGGYGFENQFETHGGLSFAMGLLAEADAYAFDP